MLLPDVATAMLVSLNSQNDIAFLGPALFQLNKFVSGASKKKHFLYKFEFCPNWNTFCKNGLGSVHAAELAYVFGGDRFGNYNYTSQDVAVSDMMMEMWTNFAKTGDPTATVPVGGTAWRPYTSGSHNYLLIGNKTESKIWPTPAVPKAFDVYLQKLEGVQGPVVVG